MLLQIYPYPPNPFISNRIHSSFSLETGRLIREQGKYLYDSKISVQFERSEKEKRATRDEACGNQLNRVSEIRSFAETLLQFRIERIRIVAEIHHLRIERNTYEKHCSFCRKACSVAESTNSSLEDCRKSFFTKGLWKHHSILKITGPISDRRNRDLWMWISFGIQK